MEDKKRILIIEDESSICDILSYAFRKEGYLVKCAFKGKDGLSRVEGFSPDVIILDLMLPDISGFDVCKEITAKYKIPIIMLTARSDIIDKVLGLELGADDYITKPFDIREVTARVKTAFRRMENLRETLSNRQMVYINDHVNIDKKAMTVYKDGVEVKLKPKEYELLLLFCENKDKVLTREEILDRVWGLDYEGGLRTVDVHVQRIRKKLDVEGAPSIIDTVFGIGYKMSCRS
ncbi:MAG: two-component system, OmpR family, alkaline phosphatase synthesis response regulator PhoP [Tepidanaerobacteraceae bacterium]|nr:two-component system, OmpR family, alkaline phosphatase synthesis response regulator PhoP [Tepidanaerobacteraceae bacterium]